MPREFTHALEPLPIRAVEAFKRVVEPIAEEDRLLCVLAQFPWSFRDTPTARDRIERIALGMAPLPVAVEVRHGGWVGGGLAALRSLGLSACAVDQPVIGDSLRFDDPVRGSAGAYFRLHGRNVREWFRPGTTRDSRYDYFYTRDELADISGRVKRAAQIGTPVSVVLNNHFRGQAVANAVELKAILVGAPVDAPADTIRRFPRLADVARTRRDSPPADGLFSGEKSAAE